MNRCDITKCSKICHLQPLKIRWNIGRKIHVAVQQRDETCNRGYRHEIGYENQSFRYFNLGKFTYFQVVRCEQNYYYNFRQSAVLNLMTQNLKNKKKSILTFYLIFIFVTY